MTYGKGIRGSLPSLSIDRAGAGLVRDCQLALVPGLAGVQSIAVTMSCSLRWRTGEVPCLKSCGSRGGSALTGFHSACAGATGIDKRICPFLMCGFMWFVVAIIIMNNFYIFLCPVISRNSNWMKRFGIYSFSVFVSVWTFFKKLVFKGPGWQHDYSKTNSCCFCNCYQGMSSVSEIRTDLEVLHIKY